MARKSTLPPNVQPLKITLEDGKEVACRLTFKSIVQAIAFQVKEKASKEINEINMERRKLHDQTGDMQRQHKERCQEKMKTTLESQLKRLRTVMKRDIGAKLDPNYDTFSYHDPKRQHWVNQITMADKTIVRLTMQAEIITFGDGELPDVVKEANKRDDELMKRQADVAVVNNMCQSYVEQAAKGIVTLFLLEKPESTITELTTVVYERMTTGNGEWRRFIN